MAGRIYFVHDACVRRAATLGCSIEVAGRVADHSRRRIAPIGPARKAVQHSLMASGVQLVDDALARRAAEKSSSIEVAGQVADHSGPGNVSISARQSAREGEQHSLMAGGIQLVYDARAPRSEERRLAKER